MNARLDYLLHKLHESFWFLPALMTIAAAALSVVTSTLDRDPDSLLARILPWSQGLGVESARLIVSTVAGAAITVASLVFSMTLVALTLAAGQLGPRLLSLFMRDRMTQFVLGTFVATFVFSLLVLASLGDQMAGTFVPKTSIFVTLVLALLSFGLLIAFVHHLAKSLHADEVIARMARELDGQIAQLCGRADGEPDVDVADLEGSAWNDGVPVSAVGCGYVQTIDADALVEVARDHGTEVRLRFRAGQFVGRGETIASVREHGGDAAGIEEAVRNAIVLGPKRTATEDPEFALQAIVEVALRALSPGVNDPYTAASCLDWLGENLACVIRGSLPPAVRRDAAGKVRLHVVPLAVTGLFDAAFNEIRQAAEGNVAVLIRLAEICERLARFASTPEHRVIVRRHSEMLARACDRSIAEIEDQRDMRAQLQRVEAALAG